MRFVFFTLLSIAIIGGCATTTYHKDVLPPLESILPPDFSFKSDSDIKSLDNYLKKMITPESEQKTHWWVDYRRAQLWKEQDPKLACDLFSSLAIDPLFPLRRLAYLRAHETCPRNYPELAMLQDFSEAQFDPWLEQIYIDVALNRAQRDRQYDKVMELSIDKSKLNLPRNEKVEYTIQALDLAKRLGKKSLAKKYQKRLYRFAPRMNPRPSYKNFIKVAYDYRRIRDFEKARHFYRLAADHKRSTFDQTIRALKGIAITYKIQQRKKEYIRALERIAQKTSSMLRRARNKKWAARHYVSSHVKLARALWTQSRVKEARKVLKTIPLRAARHQSMSEVYWVRGRMKEEQGDFGGALWWFDKTLNEKIHSSGFKQKIHWYRAWNYRKLKKYEEALSELTYLKENAEDVFEEAKYSFWYARTLREAGDSKGAQSAFNKLIKLDPLGYYGLIAHRELQKNFEPQAVIRGPASSEVPKDLKRIMNTPYIEWLIAVGEDVIAQKFLNNFSKSYRKNKNQKDKVWLAVFNYYARAGSYISLFGQLGYLPSDTRRSLISKNPHLIFPKPYLEYVSSASNRFGVSVEFIYSIMRQESAFNPRARSPMDAFGLMQMLPKVANRTARRHQLKFKEANDLYAPQVSVNLGSAFLRELWDKYNGQFIPAVASYNASDEAIATWLKTRFTGDSLQFIEDIPYEETKAYVKLVLRNLIFYQRLNYAGQKLPFPEWTLKLEKEKS